VTDALFTVDPAARRIRGLLLPYGELSRPNVSGTEPVMFAAGTVTLPADPSIVTLNEGHDQLEPRGRAVSLEDTPEGVVAEFEIARTPEGDALLTRAAAEPRPRLSAELRGLIRKGAEAVASHLRGAAVVPVGAFQSAALFAALDEIEEQEETTDEAPAEPETPEAEAEETEEEEDMTAAAATVPAGLNAPGKKEDKTTADGLFAAVAAVKSGSPDAVKAYAGGDALFAISTIQESGPSGRTIYADTSVPNYIGELWKRRAYQQRFVSLLNPGTLTSTRVMGWRWTVEPEVGDYAGNVAEIPSNAVDTEPVYADADRLAGGHKIDRKYLDFNDQGVIASYFDHMTQDVARKLDAKALAAINAAATARDVTAIEAGTGVAVGLSAIVDAALGVIETENAPAWAIVSPELWRDIILSPKDDVLEYLNAGFGLEEGSLSGFKLLPGAVGAGKVVVGAKEAATFYTLGGGAPIRVEGIDPHHGAFDPAVFAYWATLTHNAAAIQSVDVATYDTAV
jgi:hypothetical protein